MIVGELHLEQKDILIAIAEYIEKFGFRRAGDASPLEEDITLSMDRNNNYSAIVRIRSKEQK